MAGKRIHIVMSDELVERIDTALSAGQSRGDWLRRAAESYLEQYIRRIPLEDIEPYLAGFRALPRDRPKVEPRPKKAH